jgi:site-specific DNA recombinase
MMGILRGLNTQATAIDQPIDFDVPESIVMLAVYLSIPEAENTRRGKNTSDGMRRARKMGRWPARAPIGYVNYSSPDGKKIVIHKQPEADTIRWSFEEYSKGKHTISHVRRMARIKGLCCSINNFWKALHNPFYCGLVCVPATKTEEEEFVKGAHEPLISQQLFEEVQSILNSRRTHGLTRQKTKPVFLLRGFLICPFCGRMLTASISTGRHAKYRYYHCQVSKCKGRVSADILESKYEEQLKKITLKTEVYKLLELVLEDECNLTSEQECISERKKILQDILKHEQLLLRVRRHFLQDKIDMDDFNDLKKEYKETLSFLYEELMAVEDKLVVCLQSKDAGETKQQENSVFELYRDQDLAGKRHIVDLFTPVSINPVTKDLGPLQINQAISMIIDYRNEQNTYFFIKKSMQPKTSYNKDGIFSEQKISVDQAMKILRNSSIETNEEQIKVILNFLYLFTKMQHSRHQSSFGYFPLKEIEH